MVGLESLTSPDHCGLHPSSLLCRCTEWWRWEVEEVEGRDGHQVTAAASMRMEAPPSFVVWKELRRFSIYLS